MARNDKAAKVTKKRRERKNIEKGTVHIQDCYHHRCERECDFLGICR